MRDYGYHIWLADALARTPNVNKSELAKLLGVHPSQITRILKDERKLKAEEVKALASFLQVPHPDTGGPRQPDGSQGWERPDESPPPRRMIPIVGYVGAGAQAHTYAVAAGELDEVEAPERASPATVAVEIKGESLGALFDQWVVYYDDVRRPVGSDLIGKLCVVGLSDERVLIKKIRRAKSGAEGLYDLISNTEDPIRDVSIEWAARVRSMEPKS